MLIQTLSNIQAAIKFFKTATISLSGKTMKFDLYFCVRPSLAN